MELTDGKFQQIKKDFFVGGIIRSEDIKALITEISRLRLLQAQPFTVQVEIPEMNKHGDCSTLCPFFESGHLSDCLKDLNTPGLHPMTPGPGCPRYEEGK